MSWPAEPSPRGGPAAAAAQRLPNSPTPTLDDIDIVPSPALPAATLLAADIAARVGGLATLAAVVAADIGRIDRLALRQISIERDHMF